MRHRNLSSLRFFAVLFFCALTASCLFGQEHCANFEAVHISNIGPALKVAACRSSEFLDGMPNLPPGQQISYVDVFFKPTTQVFRGEERRIVDVHETAVASAEWARSELAKVIASNIPNDSCDAIGAGGVAYSVVERSLVADFDVQYQKRACTDST